MAILAMNCSFFLSFFLSFFCLLWGNVDFCKFGFQILENTFFWQAANNLRAIKGCSRLPRLLSVKCKTLAWLEHSAWPACLQPPPILHSNFNFSRNRQSSTSVLVDFSQVEPSSQVVFCCYYGSATNAMHSLRPQPRHPSNLQSSPSASWDNNVSF